MKGLALFIAVSIFVVEIPVAENPQADKSYLGGEMSVETHGSMAFELHAEHLDFRLRGHFQSGNSFFEQNWVAAPASTDHRAGLGPLFNSRSCSGCHAKDGRGFPDFDQGLLIRLSVEDETGSRDEPTYGGQFQHFSIENSRDRENNPLVIPSEGKVEITHRTKLVNYADGTTAELQEPVYEFTQLNYGPLDKNARFSPRVGPQLIGLGLLEAIDKNDIIAEAQSQTEVSGRVRWAVDKQESKLKIGRFGWKAGQPSLRQQIAAAFRNDMGLSNQIFQAENCEARQTECQKAPTNQTSYRPYDVSDHVLDRVTTYVSLLAVPTRRMSEKSSKGERLFHQIGCENCHRETWKTSSSSEVLEPLRGQTIYPYTDMLLHDMGEGLADDRKEGDASGREWRTPPLWGIGLIPEVNDHSRYLHDGRARNLEEAILWHGGEAKSSMKKFMELQKSDRDLVLSFLDSL